jgi:excisionase family DNA binding protein
MSKEIQVRLERIESLLTEIKTTARKPLDLGEAASYLHHSKSHVYQLTSKGLITHYKPNGKKIYFRREDLDAYLMRNRRAAAADIEAAAANYVVSHPVAEAAR